MIAIERRSFTDAVVAGHVRARAVQALRPVPGRRRRASGRLAGYLILSRYDTVWHLMNVAVDPSRRRQGIARALLEQMIERGGPEEQYTLEVRTSNAPAIALYERFGFLAAGTRPRYYRDTGEDAVIMWRTAETTSDLGRARVILAIETSCDDTCAAVVDGDGRIRANVISSQGIHDRYGGVVPEIASRHHLELIGDAVDDALRQAELRLRRGRAWWR